MTQATRTPRFATPILLGLWFGLVAGFLEALVRGARHLFIGTVVHHGAQIAWMPAATNGILFAVLGLCFALGLLLSPRLKEPRLWLAAFGILAAWDVISLWSPPLAGYAVKLLAIGLGFQLMRMLAPRFTGFHRLVAWTTPVMVVAVLGIGGGIVAWRASFEHRFLSRLPAASAGRPNVLLLVLDTVRSLNLSTYGYFRATSPGMDSLARRGVTFEQTISAAPWTLPGHAALFTGRWTHEQGTDWNRPLDGRWPVLSEVLARQGYTSGGFVANMSYVDRGFGLARGFAHYEDYPLTWRQSLRTSTLGLWLSNRPFMDRRFGPGRQWTRKSAGDITHDFLRWQSALPTGRPWFGFLNFFDAHQEYWSPPDYQRFFRDDSLLAPTVPVSRLPGQPVRTGKRVPIAEYDRAIRYIDDQITALLAELDRQGTLANTLVIITSDHGEEFEEHGLIGHGSSLYYPSLAIPLLLSLPGRVPEGLRVSTTVASRDLPATVMDVIGAAAESPFPGSSLSRFWRPNPPATADTVLAELTYTWGKPSWQPTSQGDMLSNFRLNRHLIRNGSGTLELYDHAADPWEQFNFYTDSAAHPTTRAMQLELTGFPLRPAPTTPASATGPGVPPAE